MFKLPSYFMVINYILRSYQYANNVANIILPLLKCPFNFVLGGSSFFELREMMHGSYLRV